MKTFEVTYVGIKTVVSPDLQSLKESYSYENYPERTELPEVFYDEQDDVEHEVVGYDEATGIPIVEGESYMVDEEGCYTLLS